MDFLDGSIGVLPAAAAAADPNPFKQCGSASDLLDLESRDEWKSYPTKFARTDNAYHSKMPVSNSVDGSNNPGARGLAYYHHQHQGYGHKPAGLPLSMGRDMANSSSGGLHAALAGTRCPFTASQWQELEHQALIFKYMMAGVAVPVDLVIPIRKSVNMNLFTALSAGSLRPNAGWGSFHLGFGNNADPEPGRCRRTDGKKWRCSKDAVPHQKYCERHMNRGRHRSRKPVEGQTAAATSQSLAGANANANPSSSSSSSGTSSLSLAAARSTNLLGTSISQQQNQRNQIGSTTLGINAFPNAHSGLFPVGSSGGTATQFKLPTSISSGASAMATKEYRCLNGVKGDLEEQQIFMPESSVTLKEAPFHDQNSQAFASASNARRSMTASKLSLIPDQHTKTGSMMHYDAQSLPGQAFGLMSEPSQMKLLSMTVEQDQRNSLFSGSSNSSRPGFGAMDTVNVGCEPQGQPLLHFFDDWPRSRDQSTLSISNPMTISSDFPANSPPRQGKLSLSPLKLTTLSRDVDPTQMELGVGISVGHTNWIPITWESPMGGPLAEVLQSTTPRDCKILGLDLMTNGWDSSSPRESSQMTSPTGVLQKTFGSHSDSSTGSSPRTKTVPGLCENLRGSLYTNVPS